MKVTSHGLFYFLRLLRQLTLSISASEHMFSKESFRRMTNETQTYFSLENAMVSGKTLSYS